MNYGFPFQDIRTCIIHKYINKCVSCSWYTQLLSIINGSPFGKSIHVTSESADKVFGTYTIY